MKLRFTREARSDLYVISRYISDTLRNQTAANKIAANILQSCSNLKRFPKLGMRLAGKIDQETDLYYLPCGKHLIFYRIHPVYISVIRILDGHMNYLQLLFGSSDL